MDTDLGALLLRVALGPMLVAHGYNKLFGAGGLQGTTGWFESLGFRAPRFNARMAAMSEIVTGSLVALGLLTPFSCAGFVGLMLVATLTDHRGKGYFVFKGGAEYTLLVALAAMALASIGAGRWSLDALLGNESWLTGTGGVVVCLALGVVAAAASLGAFYRPADDSAATS
jgi:putative oxidoreductase